MFFTSMMPSRFRFFAAIAVMAWSGCSGSGNTATGTAPVVFSSVPANGDAGVPINRRIIATFDQAMTSSTINASTFTVLQGTTPVTGIVSYAGSTAIFTPTGNLASSLPFTATIAKEVTSTAGRALAADYVWTFTTGSTADTTAPLVSSTVPASADTGVALNRRITATFNKAMNPESITSLTFTLSRGGTPISGAVSYVGTTAIFTPSANLASSQSFTATVTTGASDLAGNTLAAASTWSFTTGTSLGIGPAPVALGTAGNFVILAKSGIDTVPTSAVTGDIGVSPIDSTAITGFSLSLHGSGVYSTSTQVTGQCFAANYAVPTPSNLTTAVSNMETAYTDAAGRTTPDFVELGAGDISGMTLTPGLYKWGTGLSINTNVTLNGGPNDVWIFQIAGGITQANGTQIILAGGALPKNIFWQAFGGVAVGTTAHFEGVILTKTSIALNTGASINGRMLAQTAVTIKSSTVTKPAP